MRKHIIRKKIILFSIFGLLTLVSGLLFQPLVAQQKIKTIAPEKSSNQNSPKINSGSLLSIINNSPWKKEIPKYIPTVTPTTTQTPTQTPTPTIEPIIEGLADNPSFIAEEEKAIKQPANKKISPVTNLTIVKVDNTLKLSWSRVEEALFYKVFRSTDPYFIPKPKDLIAFTRKTEYTDKTPGVVGNPDKNYFYIVKALGRGGQSDVSNRVGEFDQKILSGYNLVSFPLQPSDANIQNLLGNQLSGGDSIATGDRVLKYDFASQQYKEIAVYIDGTGTPYDGKWFDTENFPNKKSEMKLPTFEGFWIQHRQNDIKIITIVGKVMDPAIGQIDPKDGKWQIVGTTFLKPVAIQDAKIPATGSDSPETAETILYWEAGSQKYTSAWYCGGPICESWGSQWANKWLNNDYSPSTLVFLPGDGFWFTKRKTSSTILDVIPTNIPTPTKTPTPTLTPSPYPTPVICRVPGQLISVSSGCRYNEIILPESKSYLQDAEALDKDIGGSVWQILYFDQSVGTNGAYRTYEQGNPFSENFTLNVGKTYLIQMSESKFWPVPTSTPSPSDSLLPTPTETPIPTPTAI